MDLRDFIGAVLGSVLTQAHAENQVSTHTSVPAHVIAPYIRGTLVYYSLDGTTHFRFRFDRQSDDGIRIYILEQPPYGGRDESMVSTHRVEDEMGNYICFQPLPNTTKQAREVARTWGELTLRYIRTGQRF